MTEKELSQRMIEMFIRKGLNDINTGFRYFTVGQKLQGITDKKKIDRAFFLLRKTEKSPEEILKEIMKGE